MCFEAYMKLLEYEELQHAIKESLQARKEPRLAIWISAIIGGVSIVLWVVAKLINLLKHG